MFVSVVAFPVSATDVAPCYNNTQNAVTFFTILEDGHAEVYVSYQGDRGITSGATITIQFQKHSLGFFWRDVDIEGEPNGVRTFSVSDYQYEGIYGVDLPSNGTYRVTVTYVISGSGGADDTIEHIKEAQY